MRSDPRRDIGLWVVAWEGDEIVGQVTEPGRPRGERASSG